MEFTRLTLGQLQTNGYIISENGQAVLVDPGAEADRIIHFLTEQDLTPLAILLTHAHFDHIGAVDALRSQYRIPVYVHPAERKWLMDPKLNSSSYFPLKDIKVKPAYATFELGKMKIADFTFEVIHTPGHSPGGVTFVFEKQSSLISGDCLFRGGIGRTDLIGGDQQTLLESIRKLYQFPDHYNVLSGHGPKTTIGYEKKYNPFIKE